MSRRDAAGAGRVDGTGRGGGRMGAGRVGGLGGRAGAGAARRDGGSGRPGTARRDGGRASWHGTALLVEALVLLAFLVASLALFMQVFAQARGMGAEGSELAQAVAMASDLAEEFAADPAAEPDPLERDGLTASCAVATVTADDAGHTDGQTGSEADDAPSGISSGAAGTLYRATILVTDGDGDEVYRLVTERYASGDGAEGADDGALVEAAGNGGASAGTASAADGSAAGSPSPADGDASPSPGDNASPSDQGEVI